MTNICTWCGRNVSDGATSCPHCGLTNADIRLRVLTLSTALDRAREEAAAAAKALASAPPPVTRSANYYVDPTPIWWLAAVVVAMVAYPPWEFVKYRTSRVEERPAGYSWLTEPPEIEQSFVPKFYGEGVELRAAHDTVRIDKDQLLIQMGAVAALACAGLVTILLRRREKVATAAGTNTT